MTPPREGPPGPDAGQPRETFQGLVERVTYHDEGSLYSVLKLLPEEGYDVPQGESLFAGTRATAVGKMVDPTEGIRLRLVGRWGKHPSHGPQFEFESATPLPPADEEGLVRYLASKAFEGVGEVLARRIVDKLGPNTLEILRERPEALNEVRGLRPDVAAGIARTVQAQLALHKTLAFLLGLALGPQQAQMVVASLGPDCEGLLREDPYRLVQVRGMGFLTADRVAAGLGVVGDDPRRLRAGTLHALQEHADEGHSLMRRGELVEAARRLLGGEGSPEAFDAALASLEGERALVVDRRFLPDEPADAPEHPVYLPWLHASERGLAASLDRLLREGEDRPLATQADLEKAERASGLTLHPDQRAAVLELLRSPVGLLTGGPGVGKTTIVRLIAALAEAAGAHVRLASPTGRAAKRLAEATDRPASTVHRLLRYVPPDGFEHGPDKPLDAGLVLVDEISMLDVALAHHLVKAVAPGTRLVLVGDPDQLPSVGAGNVLSDLLDSGRIPTARLTQVFRQDESSLIVENAHRVLHGELPRLPERGDTDADFYFFPEEDGEACARRVVEVVTERVPRTFGHDWVEDVQVIAPMYKGPAGVDALNDALREAAGYGGREVQIGRRLWRVGDRVIHTRNDYEREVFNGDMGRVTQVSAEGLVTVRFPEQEVVYQSGQLSDLRPAFAITVHRSQGGEFPVVVIPLAVQHRMMLQRNLLYTAITRARKLVVLVGSRRALRWAVENADQASRESLLAERLRSLATT